MPEFSELRLIVRHPDAPTLDAIWKRILKCAEAGALATETSLELEISGSLANVLPNDTLAALSAVNMLLVGGVKYDTNEPMFGKSLRFRWFIGTARLGAPGRPESMCCTLGSWLLLGCVRLQIGRAHV